MKKVLMFASAAIAALAMVSCNKEIEIQDQIAEGICPDGYYVEELVAEYPRDPETRTAFNETTGKFAWTEGDELAFHLSNGTYTSAPIDPATSKVKLYLPVGVTRDNYAVYPASAVVDEAAEVGNMQVTLPSTYDISDNLTTEFVPMPLIATNDAENKNLKFEHVGALLQVNLNVPAGVKTAKLSMGKTITGTFDLAAGSGNGVIEAGVVSDDALTFVLCENGLAADTEVKILAPLPSGSYDLFKIEYDDVYEFSKDLSSNPWVFSRTQGKKVTIKEENFEDIRDYFWLEALDASSEVLVKRSSSTTVGDLEYSLDKKNWVKCSFSGTVGPTIVLENIGDRVYFRNSDYARGNLRLGGNGRLKAGGSLKTTDNYLDVGAVGINYQSLFLNNTALVDASEIVMPPRQKNKAFDAMFSGCSNLLYGPDLPYEKLGNYTCRNMFKGCVSLVETVDISATEIGKYGCQYMYDGCSSLVYADVPSANVLDENCYSYMYYGCTGLQSTSDFIAEQVPMYGYYRMFYGCSGLKSAGKLYATKLSSNSCAEMFCDCISLDETADYSLVRTVSGSSMQKMFYGCTALKHAHDINVDEFVYSMDCFEMFRDCTSLLESALMSGSVMGNKTCSQMYVGCTSLETMKELRATTLGEACYLSMFDECSSLVNVPDCLPAKVAASGCYAQMFRKCVNLQEAPEIMIEEAGSTWASYMFDGCSSLRLVKVHFTAWNNGSVWLRGVSSTGSFYKPAALEDRSYIANGSDIPHNWTVYNWEDIEAGI